MSSDVVVLPSGKLKRAPTRNVTGTLVKSTKDKGRLLLETDIPSATPPSARASSSKTSATSARSTKIRQPAKAPVKSTKAKAPECVPSLLSCDLYPTDRSSADSFFGRSTEDEEK